MRPDCLKRVKASNLYFAQLGCRAFCPEEKTGAKAIEIIAIIAVGSRVKTPLKPAGDSADIANSRVGHHKPCHQQEKLIQMAASLETGRLFLSLREAAWALDTIAH